MEKPRKRRQSNGQRLSGIINFAIYPPVQTVWFSVSKLHFASLLRANEACTLRGLKCMDRTNDCGRLVISVFSLEKG